MVFKKLYMLCYPFVLSTAMGHILLYSGFVQVLSLLEGSYSREQDCLKLQGIKTLIPKEINGFSTWHMNNSPVINHQTWIIKMSNFCFSFDTCSKFSKSLCINKSPFILPAVIGTKFWWCCGSLKCLHFASLYICFLELGYISQHYPKL